MTPSQPSQTNIRELIEDSAIVHIAEPIRKRLQTYTLAELEALAPVEWAVHNLFRLGEVVLIYGREKSGKSAVVFDLAVKLACGYGDFMGLFQVKQQMKTLYFSPEGKRKLPDRIKGACIANGLEYDDIQHAFTVVPDCPKLYHTSHPDYGKEIVSEYLHELNNEPHLIVIDTFAHAMSGGNENTTQDLSIATDTLSGYQAICPDSVFVILHHEGKLSSGPRGGTALAAYVDVITQVSGSEDSQRTFKVDSGKDIAGGMSARFAIEALHTLDNGESWVGITLAPHGEESNHKPSVTDKRKADLIATLRDMGALGTSPDTWFTQKQIERAASTYGHEIGSSGTVQRLLSDLTKDAKSAVTKKLLPNQAANGAPCAHFALTETGDEL